MRRVRSCGDLTCVLREKKKDLQCDLQVFFLPFNDYNEIVAPGLGVEPIFNFYPQPFSLKIGFLLNELRLRTRVAVAQRIEPFNDYKDGCGFESHQSHASSEALGFSHLEPLSPRL